MPITDPTPNTWTLRFKHRRVTILLHVDPLHRLALLKGELLKALLHSHLSGNIDGEQIPSDPSDIALAKPVDINDLSAGWEPLDKDDEDVLNGIEDLKGKGKGKSVAGNAGSRSDKGGSADCPKSVGLRDGGVVAFRFRSDGELMRIRNKTNGSDPLADSDVDVDAIAQTAGSAVEQERSGEVWDVVVPSMEETYADQMMPLEPEVAS